jgi:hypothetical protein
MFKRAPLAAALIALVLWGGRARADEQSDLAKARAAYEAKNYEDADRRLRAMLDPDTGTLKDAYLRTQARMYLGATLLAEKKQAEASTVFEALLLDEPSFEPDPLSFPTEVVDAFIDTKKRIIDKINQTKAEHARQAAERKVREEEEKRKAAERVRLLERLATEEKVTERHSRWVAMVPFGVGQFQNGQTALGWVFLGTEAALLVASAVTVPFYRDQRAQALDAYVQGDTTRSQAYFDRATNLRNANAGLDVGFVVVAAIGILHAQLTCVPDPSETKKRPLPTVAVEPQKHGAVLGIQGTF